MNLYLLIAIALGAISGTTEAPVARPGFATVITECGAIAGEQSVSARRGVLHHARSESTTPPVLAGAPARIEAPLAGAATPRAPAASC